MIATERYVPGERGFVYFFLRPSARTVKIGFSTDPERRLAQIQTGCDETLQCIASFQANRSLEIRLHRMFSADRVRGEWFSLTHRLAGFLIKLLREEGQRQQRHADALEAYGKERGEFEAAD